MASIYGLTHSPPHSNTRSPTDHPFQAPRPPDTSMSTAMANSATQTAHQRRLRRLELRSAGLPVPPRSKAHRDGAVVADGFLDTKADRTRVKRSAFLGKVAASYAARRGGGPAGGVKKRRRPAKKLPAAEGLVRELGAVLEDITAGEAESGSEFESFDDEDDEQMEGVEKSGNAKEGRSAGHEDEARSRRRAALLANKAKPRLRSLRTRPGALRRKEKLVRLERTRFEANWAGLMGMPVASASAGTNESNAAPAPESSGEAGGESGMDSARPSSISDRWAALRGFIASTLEQNPAFVGRDARIQ